MDLKQLRYFVGICDAGSIRRAAQMLHVAQPALSTHISNMEAELKVELLHRSSLGVVPTESGEILYASAQRVLRDMSRVAEEINASKKDPAGKVVIGVAAAPSNIFGHTFINQMAKHFPNISLYYADGLSADLYRKLLTGMLDIGIFYKEPEITGINSKVFMHEELFIAMARPPDSISSIEPISIERLRKLPFIFPRISPFSIRRIVEDAFGEIDLSLQVVKEIDSFITIKKLVVDGFACTILPWSALYEEIEKELVVLRTIDGVTLTRNIDICTPLDRPLAQSIKTTFQMATDVMEHLVNTGQWRHVSLAETHDLTWSASDGHPS